MKNNTGQQETAEWIGDIGGSQEKKFIIFILGTWHEGKKGKQQQDLVGSSSTWLLFCGRGEFPARQALMIPKTYQEKILRLQKGMIFKEDGLNGSSCSVTKILEMRTGSSTSCQGND